MASTFAVRNLYNDFGLALTDGAADTAKREIEAFHAESPDVNVFDQFGDMIIEEMLDSGAIRAIGILRKHDGKIYHTNVNLGIQADSLLS